MIRWLKFSPLILLAVNLSCTRSQTLPEKAQADDGQASEKVIYGVDNRVDLFEETDPSLKTLSESTVALISSKIVSSEVNGLRTILGSNYGKTMGLCSDEKFYEQTTAAFCSGFLIAPDLIVTAGHCVLDLKSCTETVYAFGFAIKAQGQEPVQLPAQEIYSCKEVIHSQAPSAGADFAIVRLDRPVTNHLPLLPRVNGKLGVHDDVTLIGYPEGLPLKIAAGAQVRNVSNPAYFVANTDSYGGNSGSAVINSVTHEVEGVLVRGEKDFEWTADGCARSYRCAADSCRGEDVTRISEVLKELPALQHTIHQASF